MKFCEFQLFFPGIPTSLFCISRSRLQFCSGNLPEMYEELQQLRIPVSYDGLHIHYIILKNLWVIINNDKLNCINLVACVQFILLSSMQAGKKITIVIIHYHLQMRMNISKEVWCWWKHMYLTFPAVNQSIFFFLLFFSSLLLLCIV